ncbi:hypothetical protein LINPERPRIM_LOCUS24071 [Linum perenne]
MQHETELLEDSLALPGFQPISSKFASSEDEIDPNEPVLLFTKPLVPEKLASAGIQPPVDPLPTRDGGGSAVSYRFRGRMGRGGRIVFDRWNPLAQSPIDLGNTLYMAPRPRPSTYYN